MKPLFQWMIVLLAAVCAAVLVTGCSRTADVVLPRHVPRLVMHGYTATGDTFSIVLSRSFASDTLIFTDSAFVHNAWMVLYEDGVFKDSLRYRGEGRYGTPVVAQPGRTYRIRAGAPGFDAVEASTAAPLPSATLGVTHKKLGQLIAGGEMVDDVKVSFQDPQHKNYYLTEFYAPMSGTGFCVYTYEPVVERYQREPLALEPSNCIPSNEVLYADKTFDGQSKELVFHIGYYNLEPYTDFNGQVFRPYMKRYVITEEYYNYFRQTINLGLITGGPSLAEPVRVKGNVKNGYGLFTVFSVTTDTIP